MSDRLRDSYEFWYDKHPNEVVKARARDKAEESCPFCDGYSHIIRVQEYEQNLLCVCAMIYRENRAEEYRRQSNLTRLQKALTLEELVTYDSLENWASMASAIASLHSLSASPYLHQWIKLSGVPGCGKSHVLVATYNLISNCSIYVPAGELASKIHDSLDTKGEHSDDWLNLNDLKQLLVDVPVLFVDDLGQEHNAEFVTNALADIFVRRYQFGELRPTVVATNLTPSDLSKRYSRLEDRLEDRALVRNHIIKLPSFRKAEANVKRAR